MVALPEVAVRKPARMRMVVLLPAPLGPRKPTTCPLGDVEGDVLHGGVIAVVFRQVADMDHECPSIAQRTCAISASIDNKAFFSRVPHYDGKFAGNRVRSPHAAV